MLRLNCQANPACRVDTSAHSRLSAMKKIGCSFLALLIALSAQGSDRGDEVVVIYNSRIPESKSVADHYAGRRKVPASQVFGFELPTTETMSRAEFRDQLQKPLVKALDLQKLLLIRAHSVAATNDQPPRIEWKVSESKVRYLALCYGVPVKILKDANLVENGTDQLRAELRRNEAAVDSELACLPFVEQKYLLAGPLRNPFYTVTNASTLHPTNGILLVTRLDGPTADVARTLVDKAMQAEEDGLWGRAYFDMRGLTNSTLQTGDDWIRGAANICKLLGYETVEDEAPGTFPPGFPMSQIAFYAGWYDENVSGPFTGTTVEFMPGAFGYHLHSFSAGELRTSTRHWSGPLLAKGVTATMGCVDEPYLTGTPDIGSFFARFTVYGFSFGEAAYAAQSVVSWQTTVIGDPLYRPFARNPQERHQNLERRQSKLIEWSHLGVVNLSLLKKFPMAEMVDYLEQIGPTKQSAVLMEKLADLYAAQGKPSSSVHACQQALKLDPSPQQRVRLMQTLAVKLLALGRDEEAYDLYQQFLKEFPDYPDLLGIYRKMLPLAQKLKKSDAANIEAEVKRLSPPASRKEGLPTRPRVPEHA
jgi:uncharacterized protein (TIGR03790 family)